MNILIIGAGWVGATHAAVLASTGHNVCAYDVNKEKIADLESGEEARIERNIYEPELAHVIKEHKSNLKFTSDLKELEKFLDTTDVIFLCLPTPAHELELPPEKRSLYIALKSLSESLCKRNNKTQSKYLLIATKSTTPIGTAELIKQKLEFHGVKDFGVGSNPEFLVEGKAIENSQNPDRVIIGVSSTKDEELLKEIYRHLSSSKFKVCSPKDAEAIKLLANFELFSRIVMTYQVTGRFCELIPGLTFENIFAGLTGDERIPKWGHYTSLYAGGSCFKKDAENLLRTANQHDSHYTKEFLKMVIEGNEDQLQRFYERAKKEAKITFKGKRIALLGTTFKQGTNDVRGSPSLPLTEWLYKDGAAIKAYDPKGGEMYKNTFKNKPEEKIITVCHNMQEALKDTDACIICTDWPEFKFITQHILQLKKPYLIMDGRRCLAKDYKELNKAGFSIIAVGSPYMPG
ncbi:UDP-glucose 6-dehydrogenase AglM [uncultured archaeon]|nr:UDP-glucose 6-dehydrogenase AglM [uncultured archaeon]